MTASEVIYNTKTKPSLLLANQVGNMYTPSVYGGLVSFLIRYAIASDKAFFSVKNCKYFAYFSIITYSVYSFT